MSYTRVTTEEILAERQKAREEGALAHTPNVSGDCMCYVSCSCDTCRDFFDPTGEKDAQKENERRFLAACQAANIAPPPPSPVLTRQFAMCLDCGDSHSCSDRCVPDGIAQVQKFSQMWRAFKAAGGLDETPPTSPELGPTPSLPPPPPMSLSAQGGAGSAGARSSLDRGSRWEEPDSLTIATRVIEERIKYFKDKQTAMLPEVNMETVTPEQMAAIDKEWEEGTIKFARYKELDDIITCLQDAIHHLKFPRCYRCGETEAMAWESCCQDCYRDKHT